MTYKDLNTKGKIEHIWEYYKLRIFMILFLIGIGISLIYSIFIKPHPDLYCGIAMYDQFVSIADINKLTDELNKKFNLNKREYSVELQSFFSDDTDVMVEAELNQKFNTYIYASQFHLLLGDEEDTKTFVSSEYMAPLSDYLSNDKIAELDSQGKILYALDPYSNQTKPMAINIKDSAILKKYNLYQDRDCYIGFVPMPDNEDHTLNVLQTFMEIGD